MKHIHPCGPIQAVIYVGQLPEEECRQVICLKGKRACPRELWLRGGPYAILDAFRDPKRPENQELIEWAGNYDPNCCNIEEVNQRLQNR